MTRRVHESSDDKSSMIPDVRYVSLRVPDALYERIRQHAEADRRSLNVYLQILIERALDELDRGRPERRGKR